MYRRLLRSIVHFSRTALRKNKVIVSDVLDQFFDDDSDFSGPDSDREVGEEVYIYRGPALSTSTLKELLWEKGCQCLNKFF